MDFLLIFAFIPCIFRPIKTARRSCTYGQCAALWARSFLYLGFVEWILFFYFCTWIIFHGERFKHIKNRNSMEKARLRLFVLLLPTIAFFFFPFFITRKKHGFNVIWKIFFLETSLQVRSCFGVIYSFSQNFTHVPATGKKESTVNVKIRFHL